MTCLGPQHWYVVVQGFKPSYCVFIVCVLNHSLYCLLRGPVGPRETVLPWSHLMGGVDIKVRDLKGWPRGDGIIAFPPGDSSVDKLRNLWVVFCFMLRDRGYIHLHSVCEQPGRFLPGTLQRVSVGWMCG